MGARKGNLKVVLQRFVKSSQVYFIVIFNPRKRKQRKTIQSPSQPHLHYIAEMSGLCSSRLQIRSNKLT